MSRALKIVGFWGDTSFDNSVPADITRLYDYVFKFFLLVNLVYKIHCNFWKFQLNISQQVLLAVVLNSAYV